MTYANQRYYEQNVGRWLSQDPVFINLGVDQRTQRVLKDPQLHNSYSYARNNPIILVDEEGEIPGPVLIVGGAFLLGAGTEYIGDIIENRADNITGLDAYKPRGGVKNAFGRYGSSGAEAAFTAGVAVANPSLSLVRLGLATGVTSVFTDLFTGEDIDFYEAGSKSVFTIISGGILKTAPPKAANSLKGVFTGELLDNIFEGSTKAFLDLELKNKDSQQSENNE